MAEIAYGLMQHLANKDRYSCEHGYCWLNCLLANNGYQKSFLVF